MPRLTSKQYSDELTNRKIKVQRYAAGQVNYVRSLVDEMNDRIAKFVIKKERLETKGQYSDSRIYVRKRAIEYRERLYKYLRKEVRSFAKEQAKWVYINSPVRLEKPDTNKMVSDIFFEAFSETDNIKSYVTRLFNQIFQLWNAQLTIAYRTKNTMKNMVFLVTGKRYK